MLDVLAFIFITGVLPVVINKSTERGRFDWIHPHLRWIWTLIFAFFSWYLLEKPATLEVVVKLKRYFDHVSPTLGYIVCAILGAGALCGYWWFSGGILGNGSATTSEDATRARRVEFLIESKNPLKSMALVLDLDRSITPTNLGHYRALATMTKTGPEPEPAIAIGGRDSYTEQEIGGSVALLIGEKCMLWSRQPNETMQDMVFSQGQQSTNRITLAGGVYGKGPFKTISELGDLFVQVFVTESLFPRIRHLRLIANNYVLLDGVYSNLTTVKDAPLMPWPEKLSDQELKDKWVGVILKGENYASYDRGKQLDSPFGVLEPWKLDFEAYTPERIDTKQFYPVPVY